MPTTTESKTFFSTALVTVSEERIRDLLVGAFEGGSNYWIDKVDSYVPDFAEHWIEIHTKKVDPVFSRLYVVPFVDGCHLIVTEQDANGKTNPSIINKTTMRRGLQLMADTQPRHFADFLSENDDATTADVFLQMVVFGELIYG